MLRPLPESPSLQTADYTPRETEAMQRAVLTLFDRWGLRDEDASTLLGDISPRTISRWRRGELGRVSRDLADRLSNLLGIHKALRILFLEPQRGYDWIKRPNADFGGKTALDVMLGGGMLDLVRVRRLLDAHRGGW